jgi:hypothetical protein
MDWKALGISTVVVFGVLFASGLSISLLSSQLQCSKIGLVTSVTQGAIAAAFPSIIFALSAAYSLVRDPFSVTLQSFGIPKDRAEIVGVGYLVMLASWITTMWNIHNTEKAVCQPSTGEMTDFKKKMLAELQEKERQKEENEKAK